MSDGNHKRMHDTRNRAAFFIRNFVTLQATREFPLVGLLRIYNLALLLLVTLMPLINSHMTWVNKKQE